MFKTIWVSTLIDNENFNLNVGVVSESITVKANNAIVNASDADDLRSGVWTHAWSAGLSGD